MGPTGPTGPTGPEPISDDSNVLFSSDRATTTLHISFSFFANYPAVELLYSWKSIGDAFLADEIAHRSKTDRH